MQNVPMEMSDLAKPKPLRTVRLWRGNNMQGWQLSMDPKRGPVGKVLPILIDYPTSARHQASVEIEETVEGQEEPDVRTISVREWKGFLPAAEAAKHKPKREWVLYYLEMRLKEVELELKEAKAKPDEIRAEQAKWVALIYKANELGDPPENPLDAIAEGEELRETKRLKIAGRRGRGKAGAGEGDEN